jgi:hypothetical protein
VIGRIINNYEIRSLLGEGQVGTVYLCEHTFISRRVATKIVRRAYSEDPDRVARYFSEARAANALGHPNIVTVIDSGRLELEVARLDEGEDTSGLPYLMTECLEGETVAQRLARSGRIPLYEALAIAKQAAAALGAAHGAGIAHRNLKASDLFLVGDGLRVRIKVLDFGVAQLLGTAAANPLSLEYGREPVARADARADIQAIGRLLRQMLAGDVLPGPDQSGTNAAGATPGEGAGISAGSPDLPRWMERIIERALAAGHEGDESGGDSGDREAASADGGAVTASVEAFADIQALAAALEDGSHVRITGAHTVTGTATPAGGVALPATRAAALAAPRSFVAAPGLPSAYAGDPAADQVTPPAAVVTPPATMITAGQSESVLSPAFAAASPAIDVDLGLTPGPTPLPGGLSTAAPLQPAAAVGGPLQPGAPTAPLQPTVAMGGPLQPTAAMRGPLQPAAATTAPLAPAPGAALATGTRPGGPAAARTTGSRPARQTLEQLRQTLQQASSARATPAYPFLVPSPPPTPVPDPGAGAPFSHMLVRRRSRAGLLAGAAALLVAGYLWAPWRTLVSVFRDPPPLATERAPLSATPPGDEIPPLEVPSLPPPEAPRSSAELPPPAPHPTRTVPAPPAVAHPPPPVAARPTPPAALDAGRARSVRNPRPETRTAPADEVATRPAPTTAGKLEKVTPAARAPRDDKPDRDDPSEKSAKPDKPGKPDKSGKADKSERADRAEKAATRVEKPAARSSGSPASGSPGSPAPMDKW